MTFKATYKRKVAGRLAQRRGDAAEDIVEQLHNSLPFKQRYPTASLMRRHARKVMIGGKTRHTGEQGPDFGGGVQAMSSSLDQLRVGLWVEVEVKFVDSAKQPRLEYHKRFTDAEVRTLNACDDAGGRAILLALVGVSPSIATWCAVPWSKLRPSVEAYRATIGPTGKKIRPVGMPAKFIPAPTPASISSDWLLAFKCERIDYLEAGKREGGL